MKTKTRSADTAHARAGLASLSGSSVMAVCGPGSTGRAKPRPATEKRLRTRIAVLERRLDITRQDARYCVGVGFHTFLRKGVEGNGSAEMWNWIDGMKDGEWIKILDYWVVDPLLSTLKQARRTARGRP